MNSTTVPLLRYRDAEQAIDWLCKAFGFEVFLKVPGEGGRIEHARLTLETNMVMLASIGRPGEDYFRTPALILTVSDSGKIYRTASAAGARIMTPLAEVSFGGSMFSCQDIESHVWVFSNQDPWRKTW
jgi:uncharacterized glyoxalase superfamily protein PhnB